MAKRITTKDRMEIALAELYNPKLKWVPDQITGKNYALCLMQSEDKDEKVIVRHISPYMKPEMLLAFISGYKQALLDNCFE